MRIFIFLIIITILSLSSYAATWDMYGSMRLKSFYSEKDKYASGIGKNDLDLSMALQFNSRIGANIKANEKLDVYAELSVTETDVTTTFIYGIYDFGSFKLKVGQDYTPTDFEPFSETYRDDGALDYFGGISTGRRSQITFILPFGLDVAFIKPASSNNKTYDVILPKLELAYNYKYGRYSGKIFAGYQTYKYDGSTNIEEKTLDAYVAGTGLTVDISPFIINSLAWMGQNTGDYGLWSNGMYDYGSNKNSNDYGIALEACYSLSKNIGINAGYGYQYTDRDDYNMADAQQTIYINVPISIDKGFSIVPEIGILDYMKSAAGVKEGKETYFGAKFQMDF